MQQADYGKALALLNRAEEAVFPDGPHDLQIAMLSTKGGVCWSLGLFRQGMETYSREADLIRQSGVPFDEAGPRYNIALLAGRLLSVGQMEFDEYHRLAEQSLETAVRVGHRPVEARARLLLAQADEGEPAKRQFERALEIGVQINDSQLIRQARWGLAQYLWTNEPGRLDEALRMIEETIEEARDLADLQNTARGMIIRAEMLWDPHEREDGIQAYTQAMDAVERIRNLQPEGTIRARVFSQWTFVYRRFVGRLLESLPGSAKPGADLDLAFRVMERARARVLLDEMDAAGVGTGSGDPARQEREEILGKIVAVQRRLADPSLAGEDRAAALAELKRLEEDESVLRDTMARSDPSFARLHATSAPGLSDVQAQLDPDQALLSFQLSTSEPCRSCTTGEGGSWVIVVTSDHAEAIPLPEQDVLDAQISVFLGMLRRRDGSEIAAAERLYDELLKEALRAAGPGIRRLIIVPDGRLHALPFAALRSGAGRPPLAETFEIVHEPSASLWLRWSTPAERQREASNVLAMADPDLQVSSADPEERTADPWLDGLNLGRLPHARREARALVRHMGKRGRVLSGADASEHHLKNADLTDFGVIHLATHAVVDHANPRRSAVLLSPGAESEDGYLQIREIVELDLDGKIVFLTACRGASGELVEGEGILGLGRAFFQAGASTVVGSLWPLRDDEAAVLAEELARQISRGHSVAAALSRAQARQIQAGLPATAWSGLAVFGNGEIVPMPGGSAKTPWLTGLLLVIAVAVLLLAVLLGFRRSRLGA
jgi:CHAT domain-containing protein